MKAAIYSLLLAILSALHTEAATVAGKVGFVTKRGQKPKLTETVVWLESSSLSRPKPETTQMITRAKTLIPHVVAVPVGSTVQFPNEDPIIHNLFSVSPSNPFDLGFYKRNSGKSHRFDKPGIVNVYCNVHPNMSAVVHVMPTPHYVFADAQGGFRIDGVDPGRYRLLAWNELTGTQTSSIEVTAGGEVRGTVNLTLDARSYRATQHLNKNNQPYSRSTKDDY